MLREDRYLETRLIPFFSQNRSDLISLCQELGVPDVHAKSLMAAAYKDFMGEPAELSGLPRLLLNHLKNNFDFTVPAMAEERLSQYDGTVKFLLAMADGQKVEAVLMPEKSRLTLCLSSQVGCRQACTFCYTGRMGLLRNLSAAEIIGEIVAVNRWLRRNPGWLIEQRLPIHTRITNLVFMGMGEPLDNTDELLRAIPILLDSWGMGLALKRIAISTAGHLDGLKRLHAVYPKAALALSLHATTDGERSRLMPINRRWPLSELLGYLRHHYETKNPDGWLMIQYTVIQNVNDSLSHAERLVSLLQGLPVKINLIPLNEVEPSRFQSPDPDRLDRFRNFIHQSGIRVMIRYSKGQDIAAACGQLVINENLAKKTKAQQILAASLG